MIRFYCKHCAHKIRVRDKDIGRLGKCPECGKVIRIPTESTIIEFNCENCDRVISVPKSHAGKQAICPKCHIQFIIPSPKSPGTDWMEEYSGDLVDRTTDSTHGLTLLDVPEEYKLKDEPADEADTSEKAINPQQESKEDLETEETESVGQHKLPWFIDIFLYPISPPGLTHLGIFMIILPIMSILGRFFGPYMYSRFSPGLLIVIVIVLYLSWYVTECIRDSAKGGQRAPEAFATSLLSEMGSLAQYIIVCCLIFWGPVLLYSFFGNNTDLVFWLLLAFGVFFFPMGFLASVMFDSIHGLAPAILIGSIFNTFFQYCGLVLMVASIILSVRFFAHILRTDNVEMNWVSWMFLAILFGGITLYATFVVAHLLGRFYWWNQEKLNWEV